MVLHCRINQGWQWDASVPRFYQLRFVFKYFVRRSTTMTPRFLKLLYDSIDVLQYVHATFHETGRYVWYRDVTCLHLICSIYSLPSFTRHAKTQRELAHELFALYVQLVSQLVAPFDAKYRKHFPFAVSGGEASSTWSLGMKHLGSFETRDGPSSRRS